MLTGHQGTARGSAYSGTGVGGCEAHTLRGEAVNVGRLNLFLPIAAGSPQPMSSAMIQRMFGRRDPCRDSAAESHLRREMVDFTSPWY